ncbi:MAG: hypothetical protein OXG44_02715 [Gammaproteobacteria bacterium]|nr:hypothetical protein [Gammaproteobacteria bacterium]
MSSVTRPGTDSPALPAAAQEPDRRGTIVVNLMHFATDDRRWPYVGFDGTFRVGRFGVQATYFPHSERDHYGDPEHAWTRTFKFLHRPRF